MAETIRADKWLWATRLFKTRALAAESLRQGKIRRNGHPLKGSSALKPGDTLQMPFHEGPGLRRIFVTELIDRRVSAALAQDCYGDQTPPEVLEYLKTWHENRAASQKGRPTKRDRRAIDQIRSAEDWDA